MLRLARPIPLIEALPKLIRMLKRKGYQIVRLDEMEFVDPEEWSSEDKNT